jgi:hypothetical protein
LLVFVEIGFLFELILFFYFSEFSCFCNFDYLFFIIVSILIEQKEKKKKVFLCFGVGCRTSEILSLPSVIERTYDQPAQLRTTIPNQRESTKETKTRAQCRSSAVSS